MRLRRAGVPGILLSAFLLASNPLAGQESFDYNRQAELDSQGNVYVSSDEGKLIKMAGPHHCFMVMVAGDKQTIGCLVVVGGRLDQSATSSKLEIYLRGGKKVTLETGTGIPDWHFINNGKQVSVYSQSPNGAAKFTLYDASTGRALNEMPEPSDDSPRPEWAKTRMQIAVDSVPNSPDLQRERTLWVTKALWEIEKIHPGMQRKDLLKVFTVEGGLSTRFQRTYVYRGCPYIKVDVRFKAGSEQKPGTFQEPEDDIIVSISRPYLAWGISD